MKSGKKALLLTLCAVLLVAATVMGTMAYLTATTETVVNTFTIGNIAISLDEAKVNPDGTVVTDANRVMKNTYKLMPGHTYTKDPIVHVAANSEDSYIFVKVENGISAFEAETSGDYKSISDQMEGNGWTELTTSAGSGVYYKTYTSAATATDFAVFGNFKIANNANEENGWSGINAEDTKVTVIAYAVQKDGFTDANAAWDATFANNT